MTVFAIYAAIFALALIASLVEAHHDAEQGPGRRKRLPANLALAAINAALASSIPLGAIVAARLAQQHDVGLLRVLDAPWAVSIPLSVAAWTLARYGLHRAMHAVPLLWRFHRIHHCDPLLDGSTAFRHHPGEVLIGAAAASVVVAAMGIAMPVLAAIVWVEIAFAIATHTGARLPPAAERLANRVFVTPAIHHIHHSDDARETDTNYGEMLTVWDRLFGSFRDRPLRPAGQFRQGLKGIGREDASELDTLLTMPWRRRLSVRPKAAEKPRGVA